MGNAKVRDQTAPDRHAIPEKGPIQRFIERRLVGNFDSADFSEGWKHKFGHAPTWCDADMSIQQINRGVAKGSSIGLYSRAFFQYWLFRIGCFVQKWPWTTVIVSLAIYTACCAGLQDVVIETDLVKLWVSQDGRLNEELNYLPRVQQAAARIKREAAPEIPKENGLGGGFQVVIQTPPTEGQNLLRKEALLQHVELMEEISKYSVEVLGQKWRLADICFKPPAVKLDVGGLSKTVNDMMDAIIPCIWITPIDCFWEGSKPLGPDPPLNITFFRDFLSSLPKGNVTWKNLNPTAVMEEVSGFIELGPVTNFFDRAGIGAAYLDRPCINPLDPDCPKSAPNYFQRCPALKKFTEWNDAKTPHQKIQLAKQEVASVDVDLIEQATDALLGDIFGRKKRAAAPNKDEDYYAYDDESDYDDLANSTFTKSTKPPVDQLCEDYGNSFVKWMDENPDKWSEFLDKDSFPQYPDYGKVMTGGCKGFGKNIMEWPEDLIIGGIKRGEGRIQSAEALQSVFLVASPFDVYLRYLGKNSSSHPNLDQAQWNRNYAEKIIVDWQRSFTRKIYEHPENKKEENVRVYHPLASTSIADMLEEFSQFNYGIIAAGYGLMIIYAAFTQARWDRYWLSVKSYVFLSFIGVFLVTYSSICGLGVTTAMGINFNAATTQVVPFLTLGLGIDDMFLLLHNFDEIAHLSRKHEMGILLKETGMSVMVTSMNNILAFCAGYILPIPALRSFCSQTAVLLAFNLASLMFIFPAFIALDLKRIRAGKRDLCFCCGPSVAEKSVAESSAASMAQLTKTSSEKQQEFHDSSLYTREQPWYTVGGFLTNYYIPILQKRMFRWFIVLITLAACVFGLVGMARSTLGLELSDILPEHTAPAAFLRAREKYFSFYPMFAVLKGENLDIPRQQQLIEDYRAALGNNSYMVKSEGKVQPYWMSLMRVWLESLDQAVDEAIAAGQLDLTSGNFKTKTGEKIKPEARIGRKMICSHGWKYNCSGRIGKVKLVKDGIINPEGFYNYLTGWYNVDNMMYYVSQASFVPIPPRWADREEKVVPPARKLLYSQIPFYQTGLVDTPPIVDMIEQVRGICEKYTDRGLPNYPSGLAFTFWEQYLSLRWNLFCAIVMIALTVFVVISVLMFNPFAAALVMVIVVVITIELGGFMGIVGIKMNPISAVTLICAVGIGVEFTAHVVLCFMTALGTVNARLESCLQHMFVPVFHGAISTLLGIVMLVFTPFDFVIKYFFVVMSFLVLLGILNGLCLLPVLLVMCGPKCELVPIDGSSHMPAPPPLSQQYKMKSHSSIESGSRNRKRGSLEMETSPKFALNSTTPSSLPTPDD